MAVLFWWPGTHMERAHTAAHQTRGSVWSAMSGILIASWLTRAGALLAVLLGLWTMAEAIHLVWATSTPVPIADQWDELVTGRALSLSWLFSQHNEHRMATGRLFFLIDAYLFSARNILPFCSSLAILLVTSAVLVLYGASTWRRLGSAQAWSWGLSLCFLFWAVQQENLMWAFDVDNFFIDLLAVAIFGYASKAVPSPKATILLLVLEFLCVYSMAQGMVVPALAAALAFFLRWPWRYARWLVAAAVVLPAMYMIGYVSPAQDSSPFDAFYAIAEALKFYAILLGAPFGVAFGDLVNGESVALALIVGAVGVAFFVCAAAAFLRSATREPTIAALLCLMTFVLVVNGLPTVGRVRLGLEQALNSRYTSVAVLFWISAFSLIYYFAERRGPIAAAFVSIATAPLLILVAVNQYAMVHDIEDGWQPYDKAMSAAPALLAGVNDQELLSNVTFDSASAIEKSKALRDGHASIFSDAWTHWLGAPLRAHATLSDGGCVGAISSTKAIDDPKAAGWRVVGRAWDTQRNKATKKLLLTDEDGTIVGFAIGDLRVDPASDANWIGEVAGRPARPVAIYALSKSGEACFLARIVLGSP